MLLQRVSIIDTFGGSQVNIVRQACYVYDKELSRNEEIS